VLLTGARFSEIANLKWEDVRLDNDEILIQAEGTKTGHGRRVDLAVSPVVKRLLSKLKLQSGVGKFVFGGKKPLPRSTAEAARKRLVRTFGAPKFSWQELRRTCGSYLTCAPAIYGAASAFLSAKRLGHGVLVAERNYVGAIRTIPAEAQRSKTRWRSERRFRA